MTPLIRINPPILDLDCQPVYASAHNLTGYPLYRTLDCYVHEDMVPMLQSVISVAAAHELRLRIFDAWRPHEAQFVLFAACPDPVYMADPVKGSHHNRGVALDLTLITRKGQPLDMGTDFDDMRPQSAHGARDITAEQASHRALLRQIMTSAGFDAYDDEWWHYQLPDAARYPLLGDGAANPSLLRPEILLKARQLAG